MDCKTCDKGAVILLKLEKRLLHLNTPSQGKNKIIGTHFSSYNFSLAGYNGQVYANVGDCGLQTYQPVKI